MYTHCTLYLTPNAVLTHKYAEIGCVNQITSAKAVWYDGKNIDFCWKSARILSLLRFFFGFGVNMLYM